MFEKLLEAKNFSSVKSLRDEVGVIFDPILKPWSGPNKDNTIQLLQAKIDIADTAGKEQMMKWFITRISPILK